MCRTEELYLKAFPTPRERSMWILTNFSVGKGLNLSSWSEFSCQLLKMMQRDFISYYGNRSRSEVYRKKSSGFFKIIFLVSVWLFSSHHHIRCSNQAVPKSMLRRGEVVISKNSVLSRRQEISVTAEEAVPSGRCWNDWLLGNIAGWGPFSENRWNYLVTTLVSCI